MGLGQYRTLTVYIKKQKYNIIDANDKKLRKEKIKLTFPIN